MRIRCILWLSAGCAGLVSVLSPAQSSAATAAQFDCLRQRHLAVVSAHRGRPAPEYPENAMSSLRAAHATGIPLLEIDVSQTSDGALVLLHDQTLDRTTTGQGHLKATTLKQLRAYRLKTSDGRMTEETVPTLDEALKWGRTVGARLKLDIKRGTAFDAVIQAVKQARMTAQTVIITYSIDDAARVHQLDRQQMISTPVQSSDDIQKLKSTGVDLSRIVAWTGTHRPEPGLWRTLSKHGIEVVFGTLGPPEQRLDDQYAADGDPSEYTELRKAGATVIASDAPVTALKALGSGHAVCMGAK